MGLIDCRFKRVRSHVSGVALVPSDGKGGFLAHSLAWLASTIRIKYDEDDLNSDTTSNDTEAALSRAERLLADERVMDAVNVMENAFRDSAANQLIKDVRLNISSDGGHSVACVSN